MESLSLQKPKLVVEYKDSQNVKVTISKDRFCLKVPKLASLDFIGECIIKAGEVLDRVWSPTMFTHRERLYKDLKL